MSRPVKRAFRQRFSRFAGAVPARPVGPAEPWHADSLSVLGAPNDLVPEHDRELGGLDLVVAQVKIGPAHGAGGDLQEELAGLRFRFRERRRLERLALAFEDYGAHGLVSEFFRELYGTASSQAWRVVWIAGGMPSSSSSADLGESAEPLGDDVVLVDRLEVHLAGLHERRVVQGRERLDDAANHLSDAVLDEPGSPVRLLDDVSLVRALHQLVNLRRHRLLDDLQQRRGVDLVVAQLGASDVERSEASLIVRRHGHGLEDLVDVVIVEALGFEAAARGAGDELLRARACGNALRGHADQPASAELGARGRAMERVQLLGVYAR